MTRRTEKVNKLIREEISELLQHQVKDPRLGNFVTVTEVFTTPDLRQAKIFVSMMGNEKEKKRALQVLISASGFFRRELAERLGLRHTPELNFCQDNSLEHGAYLLQLIEQVSTDSTNLNEPSRS